MKQPPTSMNKVKDLFERVPPASQEAEQGVLGCIMLDNAMLDVVEEVLDESCFYRQGHRKIYSHMRNLRERGQPIDILTLVESLRKADDIERAGGAAYVASLPDMVPAAAHAVSYATIVREKATLRSLISTVQGIAARAYEDTGDVDTFLSVAQAAVLDIDDHRRHASDFRPLGDIMHDAFTHLEKASENRGMVTGVTTGFTDLDEITCGFHPGDLAIIAGRPSMGKTALALAMTKAASLTGVPTAFFSVETSSEQLALRLFCSEARIDGQDMRRGFIEKGDWGKIVRTMNTLQDTPVFIDDSASITVPEMKAKLRRLKAEHDVGLVFVDYLQLLTPTGARKNDTREIDVSGISRGLKAMAKELRLPVVALSQLNRKCEDRNDKRPVLADLRDSGSIEQDADLVIFLYRDKRYNEDSADGNKVEVNVAKQRNGPLGKKTLIFLEEYMRFEDYVPDDMAGGFNFGDK